MNKKIMGQDKAENKLEPEPMFSENLVGPYGNWAVGLHLKKIPSLSFRNEKFTDLNTWKKTARNRLKERLSQPELGKIPEVKVMKKFVYDGLEIEEVTWQLPSGRPTEGVILKPQNTKGKLPGILALHDHGGNKYFGTRKIIKTSDAQHPLLVSHQAEYYEGMAWANEMAKRGYVVLVHDAFPFASRRVMLKDVPVNQRYDSKDNILNDNNPENLENINAYNQWAGNHESTMARSLFSAGTTWPGVFYAEDKMALDILAARNDVDANRLGCGGLSGGGMRTIFLAGQDDRIKTAVCVGFMTTWKDLVLHKLFTHTWMAYVPLLPKELDLPEILSLRAPLPTLVLNNSEDGLFTLSEMKLADKILSDVYVKAKAKDKYKCNFYPGIHKFDKAMQKDAFDWFDKWLK